MLRRLLGVLPGFTVPCASLRERSSRQRGRSVPMSLSDHHPLDDVAKELASGPISRGRALKLLGTALAGSVLALIPGVASASPPPHANAGGRSDLAPPSHARDRQ